MRIFFPVCFAQMKITNISLQLNFNHRIESVEHPHVAIFVLDFLNFWRFQGKNVALLSHSLLKMFWLLGFIHRQGSSLQQWSIHKLLIQAQSLQSISNTLKNACLFKLLDVKQVSVTIVCIVWACKTFFLPYFICAARYNENFWSKFGFDGLGKTDEFSNCRHWHRQQLPQSLCCCSHAFTP